MAPRELEPTFQRKIAATDDPSLIAFICPPVSVTSMTVAKCGVNLRFGNLARRRRIIVVALRVGVTTLEGPAEGGAYA